jgi:hypothetical protein
LEGPPSGEIRAFTSTNVGTLLLATGNSGIWRSTDDGLTWDSANVGLAERDVRMVSLQRDGAVYATTFVVLDAPVTLRGSLYRSVDDGLRWEFVCPLVDSWYAGDLAFRRLAVDSKGCLYHVYPSDTRNVVEFSSDSGATWYRSANPWIGSATASVYGLAVDGLDNIVVAASPFFVAWSGDSCRTWQVVRDSTGPYVQSADVVGVGPGGILFTSGPSPAGIHRVTLDGSGPALVDSSWRATSFSFDASGTVYASVMDGSVRKSTDNGAGWTVILDSSSATSIIHCARGGTVLANSLRQQGDLIRSTNFGTDWNSPISPPAISNISAIIQTRDSIVVAGNNRGIWSRRGTTSAWVRIHTIADYAPRNTFALRLSRNDSLYAAVQRVQQTTTIGPYVAFAGVGSSSWSSRGGVPTPFALELGSPDRVFVGTQNGVFTFSPDDGSVRMSQAGLAGEVISDFVRNRADTILAASKGSGIFRLSGGAWVKSDSGLADPEVHALAKDSVGDLFAGTSSGLFVSSDDGASWARCVGFPLASVSAVCAVRNVRVFVATQAGVYYAQVPGLETWQLVTNGLSTYDIRSLALGVDGYIYAGTQGSGVFRLPVAFDAGAGGDAGDVPHEYRLEQNYPNPFNPTTKIGFRVSRLGSRVRLVIYDVLGREVAVLVDEKKEPGRFEVRFDASRLTSGVYFYRMQAGGFVLTRRMVVVR